MAKKNSTAKEKALAALDVVHGRRTDKEGVTHKQTVDALRILSRYTRTKERRVAAKRRALKARGIDVKQEINRALAR